jgi:hypothetical protein
LTKLSHDDEVSAETMYCSKYALILGITEHNGTLTRNEIFEPEGWAWTYWEVGEDAHKTKEAAIAAAENMRQKRIASLERQISKLRAMSF